MILPLALILLVLHGPDGREIDINADEVTSLQCRLPNAKNQWMADGVNAIINTTDGKYLSVRETCEEIKRILEGRKRID